MVQRLLLAFLLASHARALMQPSFWDGMVPALAVDQNRADMLREGGGVLSDSTLHSLTISTRPLETSAVLGGQARPELEADLKFTDVEGLSEV